MGVVYKKICSETGLIYYGKFKGTWDERCRQGWSRCSCEYFVNPTHEFIEIDIPNDKLFEREQFYINNNECVNIMGKYIHLTKAEYFKQYRINNKDIIKKNQRQYNIDNKEKRKQYNIDNKERIKKHNKQYRIDNRDSIIKKRKQNYENNKHSILENNRVKIKCDRCGSTINKVSLKRHQRTNKCMTYLNKY
tara:strand:+ start:285 stop:860 length:576 start_codon:yes stop_codon:yes gene_type:complete